MVRNRTRKPVGCREAQRFDPVSIRQVLGSPADGSANGFEYRWLLKGMGDRHLGYPPCCAWKVGYGWPRQTVNLNHLR